MSQMLGLDFMSKYADYKKKCPICGNELIRGISCSDSDLDMSQYCKCGWNQMVYHKYYEEQNKY